MSRAGAVEGWKRCAKWVGVDLEVDMVESLARYRDWLVEEAMPAGGIGPSEAANVDRRHIGDSILFSIVIDDSSDEVWDLGSGVGLPGVPLAVLHPAVEFVLLDRSGRRTTLTRRAVRILGLKNVQVRQGEITDAPSSLPTIVSRATLTPDSARRELGGHLGTGGRALIGGSWDSRPSHQGWKTIHVPASVLDQDVWLLMMQQS